MIASAYLQRTIFGSLPVIEMKFLSKGKSCLMDKHLCHCRLRDIVRRQSCVLFTSALCPTLFSILNSMPSKLLIRQRAELMAVKFNVPNLGYGLMED